MNIIQIIDKSPNLDMPPSHQRLKKQEQIGYPLAVIFIIEPLGKARLDWQRASGIG